MAYCCVTTVIDSLDVSRPRSWPLAFDVDGGVSFATVVRLGSVNARAIFDLDMDLALTLDVVTIRRTDR